MLNFGRGGYSRGSASSRYFSFYLSFLRSKSQHGRSIRFVVTFHLDYIVPRVLTERLHANLIAFSKLEASYLGSGATSSTGKFLLDYGPVTCIDASFLAPRCAQEGGPRLNCRMEKF